MCDFFSPSYRPSSEKWVVDHWNESIFYFGEEIILGWNNPLERSVFENYWNNWNDVLFWIFIIKWILRNFGTWLWCIITCNFVKIIWKFRITGFITGRNTHWRTNNSREHSKQILWCLKRNSCPGENSLIIPRHLVYPPPTTSTAPDCSLCLCSPHPSPFFCRPFKLLSFDVSSPTPSWEIKSRTITGTGCTLKRWNCLFPFGILRR